MHTYMCVYTDNCLYMCVYVCVPVYVQVSDPSSAGVIGGCEPPNVGARTEFGSSDRVVTA